ncbi:hypothetical protein CYY_009742 [Polysphondylium violaceum]|uniref:MHD domain-containing protein n=1 Tax=Polysphondylium violaceum TaxID=133409 RepID=A0A8J4UVL2_9MYCE|nr:hypothetical protein CYY_009742 [Polysphondylium violaceum]
MFSQLFILNHKGDTIIFKEYRFDISTDSADVFFKYILSNKSDVTPAFNIDGVNYLYVKKRGMYFVMTTKELVSPSLAFELLNRAAKIIQDYTASLTEEAIRLNFILIYELLDELMDNGIPQSTSTETLKSLVFTPPTMAKFRETSPESIIESFMNSTSKVSVPQVTSMKPINESNGNNELYVDFWEHLTVLYAANGTVLRNEINGKIVMKSYLKGNPGLSLGLNTNFMFPAASGGTYTAGDPSIPKPSDTVIVDDCSFHECATNGFSQNNVLNFRPPQGEFTLFKYRISNNTYSPFLVSSHLESNNKNKLDLVVRVRSNYSGKVVGKDILITIPIPKSAKSCTHSLDHGRSAQSVEYQANNNIVVWTIPKLRGGVETILRLSVLVDTPNSPPLTSTPNNNNSNNNSNNSSNNNNSSNESSYFNILKKEIGPVRLEFEIPMFSCSTLQIKFLKVVGSNVKPERWFRYITDSKSFVVRVS